MDLFHLSCVHKISWKLCTSSTNVNLNSTKTAPFSSAHSTCFCLLAVGHALFHGFWGPDPCLFLLGFWGPDPWLSSSWVLGSRSLAVFLSFHYLLIDGCPCLRGPRHRSSCGTSAGATILTSVCSFVLSGFANELSTVPLLGFVPLLLSLSLLLSSLVASSPSPRAPCAL